MVAQLQFEKVMGLGCNGELRVEETDADGNVGYCTHIPPSGHRALVSTPFGPEEVHVVLHNELGHYCNRDTGEPVTVIDGPYKH